MDASRSYRFDEVAAQLGYGFDGEIKVGGNYVPWVRHGDEIYISGQIPRVGDVVAITGRVGTEIALPQAQLAAKICVMRALALLRQSLGTLDKVKQVLRISVYVQCAQGFTQLSEVADGASEVLHFVLGPAGRHARTSIGVYQLPKDASVEVDLMAAAQ